MPLPPDNTFCLTPFVLASTMVALPRFLALVYRDPVGTFQLWKPEFLLHIVAANFPLKQRTEMSFWAEKGINVSILIFKTSVNCLAKFFKRLHLSLWKCPNLQGWAVMRCRVIGIIRDTSWEVDKLSHTLANAKSFCNFPFAISKREE